MKTLLLSILALVLLQSCMPTLKCRSTATVNIPKNDAGEIFYSEVIPVDGKTAADLYIASLLWFNANYKSTKAVVQVADPVNKVLICQGIWPFYIYTESMSTNAGDTHNGGIYATLSHNIAIQCKDGKIKCDIQKVYFEAEYGASSTGRVTYAQTRTNASKMKAGEGYANCVFEKLDSESRNTFKQIREYISKPGNW